MKISMINFVVGVGAVWRITHLLHAEDGPWGLLARLRRAAGQGVWGEMLDCFYCLSVWVAAPFAVILGMTWTECLMLWPALSGAAILLERSTAARGNPAPVAEWHEEETEMEELEEMEDLCVVVDANGWR